MTQTDIRQTTRKFAEELEAGDVIVLGPETVDRLRERPWDAALYTIDKVYEIRPADETVTVRAMYQFGEDVKNSGARIFGISRDHLVTVV